MKCPCPFFPGVSLGLWGHEASVAGATKVAMTGLSAAGGLSLQGLLIPLRRHSRWGGSVRTRLWGQRYRESRGIWLLSLEGFKEENVQIPEKPFWGWHAALARALYQDSSGPVLSPALYVQAAQCEVNTALGLRAYFGGPRRWQALPLMGADE